jgi:hypothetical protein
VQTHAAAQTGVFCLLLLLLPAAHLRMRLTVSKKPSWQMLLRTLLLQLLLLLPLLPPPQGACQASGAAAM